MNQVAAKYMVANQSTPAAISAAEPENTSTTRASVQQQYRHPGVSAASETTIPSVAAPSIPVRESPPSPSRGISALSTPRMRAQARIAHTMQAAATSISAEALGLQTMLMDAKQYHSPGGHPHLPGPSHIEEARELGRQLHAASEAQRSEMQLRYDMRVRESMARDMEREASIIEDSERQKAIQEAETTGKTKEANRLRLERSRALRDEVRGLEAKRDELLNMIDQLTPALMALQAEEITRSAAVQELQMREAALRQSTDSMQQHAHEMASAAQQLVIHAASPEATQLPPVATTTSPAPPKSAEERLKDYEEQRKTVLAALHRAPNSPRVPSPKATDAAKTSESYEFGKDFEFNEFKPSYTKYSYGNF